MYIYIYSIYFFCIHPYLKCIIRPDYHNFDVLNVVFSEQRTLGFILWVGNAVHSTHIVNWEPDF